MPEKTSPLPISSSDYENVPQALKDAVCYYLALEPSFTHAVIAGKVGKGLRPLVPTIELVQAIEEREQEAIAFYRLGGASAVRVGVEIGDLPFVTLHARTLLLKEIINMAKEGYQEERLTKTGEVYEITVKNLSAALEANKQLTQIMQEVILEQSEEEEEDGCTVGLAPIFLQHKVVPELVEVEA